MTEFALDISDQQSLLAVDHDRLRTVVARVLTAEQIASAEISLALVDDAEIHRINREFLGHDYATDVISFVLNDEASPLDETARDWSINDSRLSLRESTSFREANDDSCDSDFRDDLGRLLKNVGREGEAPAEPRIASDFRYTDGSAGARPPQFNRLLGRGASSSFRLRLSRD